MEIEVINFHYFPEIHFYADAWGQHFPLVPSKSIVTLIFKGNNGLSGKQGKF